jgi:hypothetical protein
MSPSPTFLFGAHLRRGAIEIHPDRRNPTLNQPGICAVWSPDEALLNVPPAIGAIAQLIFCRLESIEVKTRHSG